MSIIIKSDLSYGQIVYLKTDIDQLPRQVVAIQGTADGGMLIKLVHELDISWHYRCEISTERDIVLTTTN